jgi:hypothetical protein
MWEEEGGIGEVDWKGEEDSSGTLYTGLSSKGRERGSALLSLGLSLGTPRAVKEG